MKHICFRVLGFFVHVFIWFIFIFYFNGPTFLFHYVSFGAKHTHVWYKVFMCHSRISPGLYLNLNVTWFKAALMVSSSLIVETHFLIRLDLFSSHCIVLEVNINITVYNIYNHFAKAAVITDHFFSEDNKHKHSNMKWWILNMDVIIGIQMSTVLLQFSTNTTHTNNGGLLTF